LVTSSERKSIAFLIYYHKNNKYSFNALLGALEVDNISNRLDIFYIKNEKDLLNQLDYLVKRFKVIVLGFSFFTTQLWAISKLVKTINQRFTNIIKIAGGSHPTGDPKGTLKLGFDIVFIGEAEETIIEFFNKLIKQQNYKSIKGIAFLNKKGEYEYTGKRSYLDLNKYPPFPVKSNKFGAVEITRGCPFVCYFCQTPYILGTHPRHRSIQSICKYVRIMKEKNLTDVRFITPNAFSYGSLDGKTLNLRKLEELLQKIKTIIGPKGRIFLGSFPSEVRPEHVTPQSLDLILNYCSNDNIIIGAQSGSQKILDLCHRGHSVKDVYNAVELSIKKGLKANVDFIFGLPEENENDIIQTIDLMKKLSQLGARIHTHSFIPLPQTPFASKQVYQINEEIKNIVKELIAKGKAFGDWEKQEKQAIQIAEYFKNQDLC